MYSLVYDFNLKTTGDEAEKYLAGMLRGWPALFEKVPGVIGISFLGNAFALAGKYSFSYRLDIESLQTLRTLDKTLKSNDNQWKNLRAEWFKNRGEVKSRLLKNLSGASDFCKQLNQVKDNTLVYTLSCSTADASRIAKDFDKRLIKCRGIQSIEHNTVIAQPQDGFGYELWSSVKDFDTLEEISKITGSGILGNNLFASKLYGILRELDGNIFGSA